MGQENTQAHANPRNGEEQGISDQYRPERSQNDSEDRRFGEGMEAGDGLSQKDTPAFDTVEEDDNYNLDNDKPLEEGGLFGSSLNKFTQPHYRQGLL